MTKHPLTPSSLSDAARTRHDINNRIQALMLGVDLLKRSDDDDVRLIARDLRAELNDLYALLNQT